MRLTQEIQGIKQAKVHAETEDDLQLADKRFVMRVLNHELKPRLEKRGYPVAGGFFNFVEQKNSISSTEKLNIAERVNQITIDGVDDNYFYEEFGLPRGKKTKEKPEKQGEDNMLEQEEEDEEVESVIDNEEEKNKKQPKKRKIKAKELSLFERMMNFFAHAPR